MRRIPGVGGWVTKKLMAMQAEVLNQSLDDDENQRPRTPYVTTSSHLLGLLQSMLSWPPVLSWQPMFSWQPLPSWQPMLYSAEPNTSQLPTTSRQGRAIMRLGWTLRSQVHSRQSSLYTRSLVTCIILKAPTAKTCNCVSNLESGPADLSLSSVPRTFAPVSGRAKAWGRGR